MTIKIFLIDDHTLVRVGMKMILSNELDLEVIGEAETGRRLYHRSVSYARMSYCVTCISLG